MQSYDTALGIASHQPPTAGEVSTPRKLDDVPGWLTNTDGLLIEWLLTRQTGECVSGDLLELGAYQGRTACHLARFLAPGERVIACDLFDLAREDPSLRPGARKAYRDLTQAAFERNYFAFHDIPPIVVRARTDTIAGHVAPASCRFVHVDASHMYEDVRTDLSSTRALLGPEGVVAVACYRTEHTPGAAAAVWETVANDGLRIVCVTAHKFYGTWGDPSRLQDGLTEWLSGRSDYRLDVQSVLGQRLLRVVEASPRSKATRAGRSLAVALPADPYGRDSQRRRRFLDVHNGHDTAVQRQLRRTGLAGHEPLTAAIMLGLSQQAPPGAVVYDVGAHIGLYAALVKSITGTGGPDVYAFEPSPTTAAIARQVRDSNGLSYEVVETAVADKPGSAELYLSLKAETSNSLNPDHRPHARSVQVPVTTIDQFTAERGLTPYLIKIDVETFEAQVLGGALATLRTARPWVVCELLRQCDHTAVRAVLEQILPLGYHLYQPTQEVPWPERTAADYQQWVDTESRDWLLAPEPLTAGSYRWVRAWLAAILACDEQTNVTEPLHAQS